VEWLRAQGHDAKHLRQEGLQRMIDRDIFRKAATEGRVVLTFDLDFGEILALSQERMVSVVLFRLHNTRTPHVIERLRVTLDQTKEMLGVRFGCGCGREQAADAAASVAAVD
jgi:predicted nuclease of predicted toxin-antitoxin system